MTYLLTNQIFRISEKAWNTHFVYDDDALNGKGKIDRINKKERKRKKERERKYLLQMLMAWST